MPRARLALACLEALQVGPAGLVAHRPANAGGDPLADHPAAPALAAGRPSRQRLAQLLDLRTAEQGGGRPRPRVLPIDHGRGASGVVAPSELADPVGRIAGALGYHFGGLPACEQPEDLPPAPFVRLVRLPVASFQFVGRQVRRQVDSSHAYHYTMVETEML